jgi:glycosyltransferase involved in cell wall biosynthesis
MSTATKASSNDPDRRSTRRRDGRTSVLFLSWGAVGGRAHEIADALGGSAHTSFPPGPGTRPPVPVRYVIGILTSAIALARHRPRAVIATNPPVLPGLLALGYCHATRTPLALDAHPGAFGLQGDRNSARLLGITRMLVRHSTVCCVTTDELVETVASFGGSGIVLHEAPGCLGQTREGSLHDGPRAARGRAPRSAPEPGRPAVVLFVARLAADEPVGEVLEAARLCPDVQFEITGRRAQLSEELRLGAPPNVRYVGFLPEPAYREALETADAVLALSTEPASVMRAAYEAVYACRPLVISDWPINRALFPDATLVDNDPASIAAGVAACLRTSERQVELRRKARRRQLDRWQHQLGELAAALRLDR